MKEEAIAAKTASPGSEDRQSPAPIRSTWNWYVVHTKPRQEGIALENLERQGYRCYLPRRWVQKVRRGKAQLVQEALFARYLFIHLDSSHQGQSWTPIRSTLGVAQLVRFGTQPAKVDDALIELLRAREAQAEPQALFAAGDAVIVTGFLPALRAW